MVSVAHFYIFNVFNGKWVYQSESLNFANGFLYSFHYPPNVLFLFFYFSAREHVKIFIPNLFAIATPSLNIYSSKA